MDVINLFIHAFSHFVTFISAIRSLMNPESQIQDKFAFGVVQQLCSLWTWAGTCYYLISKACTFPNTLEISEFVLALLQLSILLDFWFVPGPDLPLSGIPLLDLNQRICKTECFPINVNNWTDLPRSKGSHRFCLWQRKVVLLRASYLIIILHSLV